MLLLVKTLLATVHQQQSSSFSASCFSNNIDYNGGDITSSRGVHSIQECQDLCKENKECEYFTVQKSMSSRSPNQFHYNVKRCWLKRGPGGSNGWRKIK